MSTDISYILFSLGIMNRRNEFYHMELRPVELDLPLMEMW